jgi:hypothetical protein
MYVVTHTHTHTHKHTHTRHAHTQHTQTHTQTHRHTDTQTHTHTHANTHTYIYIYLINYSHFFTSGAASSIAKRARRKSRLFSARSTQPARSGITRFASLLLLLTIVQLFKGKKATYPASVPLPFLGDQVHITVQINLHLAPNCEANAQLVKATARAFSAPRHARAGRRRGGKVQPVQWPRRASLPHSPGRESRGVYRLIV